MITQCTTYSKKQLHRFVDEAVFYTLLIPLGNLSAKPICPLVDALAGSCGYGDDGYVRIELFDILSALIKIKVKVRHDVDLIDEEHITD